MSKKAVQIIVGAFLFSLVYGVLRYHVFEAVPVRDFPLYVLNKCIALTAFILLTINFALGPAKKLGADVPDSWLSARKEIGISAFVFVLVHLIGALLIFGSGGYYAKFFAPGGGISGIGGWSLLFGVLAFAWLWLYNISFKTHQEGDEDFLRMISSKGSLMVAAFLAAGHVVVMGHSSWFQPATWAGGMPPITLVAFAIFLVGFVINVRGRSR